jgi:hypothetical protein
MSSETLFPKATFKHYLQYALMQPWHIVVLASATVFGVANWSLFALLTAFFTMELFLLVLLHRLPSFRAYVQEQLDSIVTERSKIVRASTLSILRPQDRSKFTDMENAIAKWQASFRPFKSVVPITALAECQRLLKIFLTLSLERARISSLNFSLPDLEYNLMMRRRERLTDKSPILEERISTMEKHIELLSSSKDHLDIDHQMSAIAERIYYTIDHASIYSRSNTRIRIGKSDSILTELSVEKETIEEMQEFLSPEEMDVDIDAVLLGRPA